MYWYLNPNKFEKLEVRRQKFLKHLHGLNTKLHGKHWLYTVLCCRFNATQRPDSRNIALTRL